MAQTADPIGATVYVGYTYGSIWLGRARAVASSAVCSFAGPLLATYTVSNSVSIQLSITYYIILRNTPAHPILYIYVALAVKSDEAQRYVTQI